MQTTNNQRNVILSLFTIPLLVTVLFSCTTVKQGGNEFYDGQILLPDYAHTDTLTVTNGKLLNSLFAKYKPATDGEISDILYKGTKPTKQVYSITCNNDTIYLK